MEKILSPDDIARHFKLHNCVNNPRFKKQIEFIQKNVLQSILNKNKDEIKDLIKTRTHDAAR